MPWQWITVGSAIALVGGFARLVSARRSTAQRMELATEFLTRFQGWANGHGKDNAAYVWLTHRSPRLQDEMGAFGIIHHFKPPFAAYTYRRYPMVINYLPEMRRMVTMGLDFEDRRTFFDYASSLQEALVRHIGVLEDTAKAEGDDLRNPFAWLRAAIQFVLLLPLLLLEWMGLDRHPAVARVTSSWVIQLISALGVLASLVTILDGWSGAGATLHRWLSGLFR